MEQDTFLEIYEKLEYLSKESSTNAKKSMLDGYLNDDDFVRVVQYALNQGWTYSINSIELIDPIGHRVPEDVFVFLDYLKEKGSASQVDKVSLAAIASCFPKGVEVVNRILSKDLRCGIKMKQVNNVRKGTVKQVPYQRCSSMARIKNISYPALIQKKADSMFSYSLPFMDNSPFLTRNGNYWSVDSPTLINELKQITEERQEVCVGEAQVLDEDGINVLDRVTGNGILNSIIQGKGTQDQMDRVIYDVWDIIPYDHWMEHLYEVNIVNRFRELLEREKHIARDRVQVIPYKFVNSLESAKQFYFKMRRAGYEGAILKNFNDHWKFNTSTKQIKFKNESVAEFIIVDVYAGEKGKKWEGLLGGVIVETSDGKLRTRVGKGFSDEQRKEGLDHWREKIGNIVSVKYEKVIRDKRGGWYKLMDSTLDQERFDKDEADTLEYCMEISDGTKI